MEDAKWSWVVEQAKEAMWRIEFRGGDGGLPWADVLELCHIVVKQDARIDCLERLLKQAEATKEEAP